MTEPVPSTSGLPLGPKLEQRLYKARREIHTAGRASSNRVQFAASLVGDLDVARLRSALNAVVERHDALRLVVRAPYSEAPYGEIIDRAVVDLENPADINESELPDIARSFYLEAFDAGSCPRLRAGLWRTGPQSHALVLSVDHMSFDGLSIAPFFREIRGFYRGAVPAPRPPQYSTWLQLQAEASQRDNDERRLDYWRQRFDPSGRLPGTELRGMRPLTSATGEAGSLARRLPRETTAQLADVARRLRVTPYMLLLSALVRTLQRNSVDDTINIYAPVANRSGDWLDTIGWLADLCLIQVESSGDETPQDLVRAVRTAVLGALSNWMPLALLTRLFAPMSYGVPRNFYTIFANLVDGQGRSTLSLPGLSIAPLDLPASGGMVPGISMIAILGEELVVSLRFDQGLLDSAQAALIGDEMIDDLRALLFASGLDSSARQDR